MWKGRVWRCTVESSWIFLNKIRGKPRDDRKHFRGFSKHVPYCHELDESDISETELEDDETQATWDPYIPPFGWKPWPISIQDVPLLSLEPSGSTFPFALRPVISGTVFELD